LETANHIFFECAFAGRFWNAVDFQFSANTDVHAYAALAAVLPESATTFILLRLWNLWKHRNAVAFR
jgi:hypothetical protein